jgi:hypothetical protein
MVLPYLCLLKFMHMYVYICSAYAYTYVHAEKGLRGHLSI